MKERAYGRGQEREGDIKKQTKKGLKWRLTKSLLLRTLELGIAQKVTSKAPAEAHRQVNVPKIKHEPGITESYK